MASSSSSRYGVFLSFRGTDTRRTFVSHLHKALVDRGIVTFKDDETIKTGEPFPNAILEAIKDSSFAIIVISENFTSSKWCLVELRSIMELWKTHKIRSSFRSSTEWSPLTSEKKTGVSGNRLKGTGVPRLLRRFPNGRRLSPKSPISKARIPHNCKCSTLCKIHLTLSNPTL